MKPIKFKQANTVFAENQPEYFNLPASVNNGIVKTCWKMTFIERLYVLFTGCVWLEILTHGNPLQPLKMSAPKPEQSNEN